ncbi:MAG TPA: hypothetical protein VI911_08385 [Patescibacteria group bacterium]|nr:hypothetical protein [Patescibacteria group bacterium]
MIVLPNGDKWILDDSEWKDAGISYEDACACKLPIMSNEEFINELINPTNNNPFEGLKLPRKWTTEFNGYWDCNFSVFEIFDALCTKKITTPWLLLYVMPWGKVLVVYTEVNDCGEAETGYMMYNSMEEYTNVALGSN